MKKLVFIVLVLFGYSLHCQDTINNFIAAEGDLYWQRVYQTDNSFDGLVKLVQESGLLDGIEVADNMLIGNLVPVMADYKGAGYSEMTIPMYVPRHTYSGFINIEYKEGRYRVTLKNILLTKRYDCPASKQGTQVNLEFFALKKNGAIAGGFKKKPSIILNYTFTDKFEFTELQIGGDW
jgi:hypothetical protein